MTRQYIHLEKSGVYMAKILWTNNNIHEENSLCNAMNYNDKAICASMLVMVLDCSLSSVTTVFPASWFINSLCVHIVFERSIEGAWHNLSWTSSDRVVCWNKLVGCWQLKGKKNSLLTIINYLLEYNGVTIIYIYIYIVDYGESDKMIKISGKNV